MNTNQIRKYNAVRRIDVRDKLCHAPWVSLNFEQNGNITACCFNRKDVLGKYPEQSISEIWHGKAINLLRQQIENQNLDGGCKLCKVLIESGNYRGTKAIHYDEYAIPESKVERLFGFLGRHGKNHMPRVFEFEISNTCNLECEMCNGYFSSTIRKKREKLPPLKSPYDDGFVNQLNDFIPHLTDMKFLGGEPFLIDIYYQIWERVAELNPNVKIHVTTNGTVLNNRVREVVSKLRFGVVFSIDSVSKELFEEVRAGARFEKVIKNFDEFHALTQKNNTYLSIAACAMSNNWKGIPDLVRFANEKKVPIHFNVVWNPGHLSMRYLSYDELEKIDNFFSEQHLPASTSVERGNRTAFEELHRTVSHWKDERALVALENMDNYADVPLLNPNKLLEISRSSEMFAELTHRLLLHYASGKPKALSDLEVAGLVPDDSSNDSIKAYLFKVWQQSGDTGFFELYFSCLPTLASVFYGSETATEVADKCRHIVRHVTDMRTQQAVISDLIDDVDRKSVVNHLQLISSNDIDRLLQHINENY